MDRGGWWQTAAGIENNGNEWKEQQTLPHDERTQCLGPAHIAKSEAVIRLQLGTQRIASACHSPHYRFEHATAEEFVDMRKLGTPEEVLPSDA